MQRPRRRELNVNPIGIAYSSSHEDFENRGVRERRHARDDHVDLKIEELKFDANLKSKNHLDWVQAIEMIFELKEYNDEKAFKLAILKIKEYASL